MPRVLLVSLLLTSALSSVSHAALVFPRQDSTSTSTSLDQVYSSLETFSTEVSTKIANGQCTESENCGGWLQSALACVGDGSADSEALAKCACQDDFTKTFAACVTCVGTDSANKAGQALTQVCDSSSSSATTSSQSQSQSLGSASSTSTSSGNSSAAETSSSTSSGSDPQPTRANTDSGSGVEKLALNQWSVLGAATAVVVVVAGLFV